MRREGLDMREDLKKDRQMKREGLDEIKREGLDLR